jgi:hypothetical protein
MNLDGKRCLNVTLWVLIVLAALNLLLTLSLSALVGGILILVMVLGIRRGDYPLAKGLRIFLYLYSAVNLLVLGASLFTDVEAQPSALIWLGLYTLGLLLSAGRLSTKRVREYLITAPQPEKKEKKRKIQFFHGGWRDL